MQRNSRKRDSIYRVLAECKSHPTAAQLYEMVREEMPEVSLSTVYRNLAQFCQSGRAWVVGSVEGELRYDADMSAHDHFICRVCNRVLDLERTESMEGVMHDLPDMEPQAITIYGLCSHCKNSQAQ